jgi:hypothetical protein
VQFLPELVLTHDFIVWIGRYGAGLTGHSQVDDDDADGFQDEMSEMEMDLFRVRARDDYGHNNDDDDDDDDDDDSHGHGHADDGDGDADGNVSVVDAAGHFATTRTRNAPPPRSRNALQELASESSSTDQNADVYVKHPDTHHLLVCFAALALC